MFTCTALQEPFLYIYQWVPKSLSALQRGQVLCTRSPYWQRGVSRIKVSIRLFTATYDSILTGVFKTKLPILTACAEDTLMPVKCY